LNWTPSTARGFMPLVVALSCITKGYAGAMLDERRLEGRLLRREGAGDRARQRDSLPMRMSSNLVDSVALSTL
jgi:hypothetical protein